MMKPNVTFFADASVSPEQKASGFGFWIKGDNRPSIHGGGPLKRFSPITMIAELEAIANGLTIADQRGYFSAFDRIILIQSDNVAALSCIRKLDPSARVNNHADSAKITIRKKGLCQRAEAATRQILTICNRHNLQITLRHVRGHQPGGGRNWVNALCDALANKGRHEAAMVSA